MLDTKSWYYFIKSCRVSDDLAVVIYAFKPPPPDTHHTRQIITKIVLQ